MARYQRLFDAFGPGALGQIAAAVVIGGLVGFVASRRMEATEGVERWWFAVGGAAAGLVAGVLLALWDRRRKRVAAGVAKPLSTVAIVVLVLLGVLVFFVACGVYVMR